ncbi:hypothetical protein OH76DRAFT_1025098 [Lentinus brumalis]|uniref:Uncharacterized protein n=1 Tax=Lentinus brumalis TaxID=2498619 RepID=A0A371CXK7_9APHY|nr:hypothetical protein OH76DRAFT_1025098 [Polyporus brumalis]
MIKISVATRAASHIHSGLIFIHATIARRAIQYGTVNCSLPRRRADTVPPDSCALAIQEPARTRKQSEHTTGIATAHTYCLNDRGAGASHLRQLIASLAFIPPRLSQGRSCCAYRGRNYVGPIYMLKRHTHIPIAIEDRAGIALACELVCLLTTGGRSLRMSLRRTVQVS